jgi:hypothetical protein
VLQSLATCQLALAAAFIFAVTQHVDGGKVDGLFLVEVQVAGFRALTMTSNGLNYPLGSSYASEPVNTAG